MKQKFVAVTMTSMLAVGGALLTAGPTQAAPAAAKGMFDNCTALNKTYPHGVGRATARDRTTGTPVTTWKRSTPIYNRAMSINSRLDGDKDGVACEKK